MVAQFPSAQQVWPALARVYPWVDIVAPGPYPFAPSGVQPTSAAWGTANLARFIPFLVSRPVTVTNIHVYNFATIAGNVDVGLYDMSGNRLVSGGGAAHSGADAIQTFNITDTLLSPGRYYAAMASDSATATFGAFLSVDIGMPLGAAGAAMIGIKSMATAYVLPATATLAALTVDNFPFIVLGLA